MLLIAQPKSASTSLLYTLCSILKLKPKHASGKIKTVKGKIIQLKWKKCQGFTEIQKYHDTTIKRDFNYFNKWIKNKKILYREHILPTKEHLNYIKKVNSKILILLRDPEDSVDNYRRMYQLYLDGKMNEKDRSQLYPERLDDISFEKLLNDFIDFNIGYKDFNFNKKFIITYEDLILNYKSTIKKVIEFFNFNISSNKIIPLIKSKYKRGTDSYTGQGEKRLKEEINDK
jgi:hypothetical protein